MSNKELRITLQGEDNLSPVAKKVAEQIEKMKSEAIQADEKIVKMKSSIRDLQSAKTSAKKGLFDTDIIKSKELKSQLDVLISEYKRLSLEKSKASKEQLKTTSAKIEQIYTQAINKEKSSIDRLTNSKRYLNSQISTGIRKLNSETRTLKQNELAHKNATNSIVRHIRQLESFAVAMYGLKKAYDVTLGVGLKYNILLENEKRGLAATYMLKLADVDATGKQLSVTDKWALSQKLANKAFKELVEINKQTPNTLGQTIQIYRVLFGTSKQYGVSQEKLLKLTKLISIAAGSSGVQFQPLLASIDGLASGTVKANSDLGKMLTSMGLTNSAIKEAAKTGSQFDLIINKIKELKEAGSLVQTQWAGITTNLKTQWDILWGDIQKPLFEELKKDMTKFTTYLQNNKITVEAYIKDIARYIKTAAELGATILAGLAVSKVVEGLTLIRDAIVGVELAQIALNKSILKNPYVLGAVTLYGLYEGLKSIIKPAKDATKAMNDFKNSVKGASLATLNNEAAKIKKEIAEATKLNAESRYRLGGQIVTGHSKKYTDEIVLLKKQLDIINKQIKAINKRNKELNNIKFKTQAEAELAAAQKLYNSSFDAGIEGQKQKLKQKYDDLLTQYKDSKEAQNLLDKWYYKELKKLDDKEEKQKNARIKREQEKQQAELNKELNTYREYIKLTGTSYDKWLIDADEKIRNLAKSGTLTSKQLAKAWEAMEKEYNTSLSNSQKERLSKYIDYYTKIGDYAKAWSKKEQLLRLENTTLTKEELDKLISVKKTNYWDKIKEARYKNYEQAKKDLKAFQLDQLKKYGTLADGIAYEFKENIPTAFEKGVELMKDITSSFSDAWTNFFDTQSKAFLKFGDLGKSVIKAIEKSLINSYLVKPLTSFSSGLLSSLIGGVATTSSKKLTTADVAKRLGLVAIKGGGYQGFVEGKDGKKVKVVTDAKGNIKEGSSALGNATNLISAGMLAKNLYTKGLAGTIGKGFASLASGLQSLGLGTASATVAPNVALAAGVASPSTIYAGTGLAGGVSSFGSGVTSALGGAGVQGLSGAAYAGGLATAGLAGGAGGFLLGSLGDKLLGADTYAGVGGGAGGAGGALLGSLGLLGPIGWIGGAIGGSLLGSILGGLFGKTKVTGHTQGIDIFGNATANNVEGQDWAKTFYKKKSWFHSKKWSTEKDVAFTDTEKEAIKSVIDSYNYLLKEMGIAKSLTIKGGRFDSIDKFLNEGVTKTFIANLIGISKKVTSAIAEAGKSLADWNGKGLPFLSLNLAKSFTKAAKEIENPELTKIYNVWVDYAKSVNKKVYEAFASQINQFITDKRSFTEYAYSVKGDTLGALKYKADYLQKDFETLEKTLGVTGITVDNFTQRFDDAFKKNLTPQTLKNWENLGNALKSSTDAAMALKNAEDAKAEAAKRQADAIQNLFKATLKANQQRFYDYKLREADKAYKAEVERQRKIFDDNKAAFESRQAALEDEKSRLNDLLSTITSNLNTMQSSVSSITQTVNKLRGLDSGAGGLSNFNIMMTQLESMTPRNNYEAYSKKLSDVQRLSSVLFNSDNFNTRRDQEFAKLVNANKFEVLEKSAQTEVDYLKQIELNTSNQITTTANSIASLANAIKNMTFTPTVTKSPSEKLAELKQRFADVKSQRELYKIKVGDTDGYLSAKEWIQAGGSMSWFKDNAKKIRDLSNELKPIFGGGYSINYNGFVRSLDTLSKYGSDYAGYANGGYTGNAPINAVAGLVHGQEYVVNAQTTKDLGLNSGNGGVFKEMLSEIKTLRVANQQQEVAMAKMATELSDIKSNTEREYA